jgi:cell division control protein 45
MNMGLKKVLFQKLSDLAPKYNMPDLIFPSFERNYGYLTTLSASDVVYSITALLDCGGTLLNQKGVTGYESVLSAATEPSTLMGSIREKHAFQDISSNGETGLVGAGFGTKTTPALIASMIMGKVVSSSEDKRQEWIKHFYLAYDSLSNAKLLQHGILLSIHYQRLVVQTAIGILEKKSVQSLKYFQIAILKGSATNHVSGDSETGIFGSSIPLLYRLTSFLMEAYQVNIGLIIDVQRTKVAIRYVCL